MPTSATPLRPACNPCVGTDPSRVAVRLGVRAALCLTIGLSLFLTIGCAGNKPRNACLQLDASENLNLYDGQPHVVTLYVFPLSSTTGFEGTGVNDLLGGATPPGVVSSPVPLTIAPGEQERKFKDTFPAETRKLGIVADYYRAPGDPEGTRTQVIRASCGWFRKPKLTLSAKDLFER